MSLHRLSDETLARLPPDVRTPGYDRHAVLNGVVHLGIGAFHRAHQAPVYDTLIAAGDPRWGVLGVSLRSPAVRDQLVPQDGLFTLVVNEGAEQTLRVVGAVRGVETAPEKPAAVLDAMARPEAHIVSLTVTEKGYRLDPATGHLLVEEPDIAAEIVDITRPTTAPGLIVRALQLRRERGLAAFTVLSCDNLPNNGPRIRQAVLTLAARVDPGLRDWIEAEAAFPATMIDRIVPATTGEDIQSLAESIGLLDLGMVKGEPFSQWVIEDRFAGARPDFAAAGVTLTRDVRPWEAAKLRLLNGAHSAIAYLGGLAGHAYVHEALAAPGFESFIESLWDEAQATLDPVEGLDFRRYRAELKARFANAALQHRTRQIAMDGSQKLPQRLLDAARRRIDEGQDFAAHSLAVAAWMRWQRGADDRGAPLVIDDPLSGEMRERIGRTGRAPEALVEALLSMRAVFGDELGGHAGFRSSLTRWVEQLDRDGAAFVVRGFKDRELARA